MILGIIPARGGSKRIPKKNMKMLGGKPLLQWTIEQAKSSKILNHFLISTEDEEIGKFAQKNGVEWWRRNPQLSTDEASTLSVLKEVVNHYSKKITTVVVLQPTSPIRSDGLIDTCIGLFSKNNLDSIATGFIDKNAEYGNFQHYRRQDYKGRFCDDGNIYITKADLIRKGDRIGKRFGGVIISREENLDIDDLFDFKIAEYFINHPLSDEDSTGLKRGTRYDFMFLSNSGK